MKEAEEQFRRMKLLGERTDFSCPKCQEHVRVLNKWFLADENEIWVYCPSCFTADLLRKLPSFGLPDYYCKFKERALALDYVEIRNRFRKPA